MNYGVPKKLISDIGSNFVSDTAVELYKFLGIDHHPTTSYRPQSNGQVERFNQLIKNVLSKICLFDKENWDLYLWKAMLTIRIMKHRVTGNSTSEILYGFEITTQLTWTVPVTIEDYVEAVIERVKSIRDDLPALRKLNLEKIIKNKRYEGMRYNKMVKKYNFKLNDTAQKSIETPTSKFTATWEDPYTIIRVLEKGNYWIRDSNRNTDQVNGDRLKLYQNKANMIPEVQASKLRPTLQQFREMRHSEREARM
ncbi:Pol polyprotein [Smittium culicis]|uniref:Pol polyprotein n=1 Tax=Smittium culicis TaxID=133412 RepID=A0A1R1YQD2_9FUNG|nr:Pol polyprotein [Smittium culicis]